MPDPLFPDKPKRPPFDPELVPVLERAREAMPELSAETIQEFRRIAAEGPPGMEPVDLTADGAVLVEERRIPGPEGEHDLTVLIMRPARGTGPWPGIYFIHGGGMIAGTRRSGADVFLPHVVAGRAVVVSVEYRLAPEHPDPAPVRDCYAGLAWLAKNAAELDIRIGS